jgi:HK97 gp10 family phage protein
MGRPIINVSVPDLDKALKDISIYDAKARLRIEAVVAQSTKNITKGAKQRASKKSGGLRRRIKGSFYKKDVVGYIRSYAPHSHLVEFGAAATTTVLERKKALTMPYADHPFATKAKIPKRRERPFLRPAYEDEKNDLIKNIKQAVKPQ